VAATDFASGAATGYAAGAAPDYAANCTVTSGAADGTKVNSSTAVARPNPEITVLSPLKYVSRGGNKLEFALGTFAIDVAGFSCLDIGASTGGFTDCLLQHGAKSVCAVDVGTNQLHESLKSDSRVRSFEQSDFRNLDSSILDGANLDFIVCDVSFISITKIIPAIINIMPSGSRSLLLIKPQFEIKGRHKNGIVRDEKQQKAAVRTVIDFAAAAGLKVLGVKECPFTGKDGNVEFFMLCER
jgi:23S rRNA (cytidine1920-2'-O)/16S rRNA (cytidine1409-2'-O)-methyltransferase